MLSQNNKKKIIGDNEKPSYVHYRPYLVVVLLFELMPLNIF